MQETLTEAIARLYPPGVRTQATAIGEGPCALRPDEEPATAGMTPRRLRQFSHGRWCAHAILESLGHAGTGVPVGPSRAPVWPAGIVGSISHTHDWAAAAAAPVAVAGGLGLDIEEAAPLPAELTEIVCTAQERRWLERQAQPGDLAKLVFCAKESLFKCLWPELRTFIDFQRVQIELDSSSGRYTARTAVREPWSSLVQRLTGRHGRWERLLLTTAWLAP